MRQLTAMEKSWYDRFKDLFPLQTKDTVEVGSLLNAGGFIDGIKLLLKKEHYVEIDWTDGLRSLKHDRPVLVEALNQKIRDISREYHHCTQKKVNQKIEQHVSGKYYYYDVHPTLIVNKSSPDDKEGLPLCQGLSTSPLNLIAQQDRTLPKIEAAILGKPEVKELFGRFSRYCQIKPNAYVESAQTNIHNSDHEIEVTFDNPFGY